MGSYTLWCLNRVATWNLAPLADALAAKPLIGHARHTVTLGDRARYDKTPGGKPGVLSHEQPNSDEYFVPIVVKCIGDPDAFRARWAASMTPAGLAAFNQLRAVDFAKYFGGNPAPWQSYWTLRGNMGMYTSPTGSGGNPPLLGFYDVLALEAQRTGPAVLVGYSQGGLVARFLAYMDEVFMQPAARNVAGFITVQAPNLGSPLANPKNEDNVAKGIFGLISGVVGYPIPPVGPSQNVGTMLAGLVQGTLVLDGTARQVEMDVIGALLDATATDQAAAAAAHGQTVDPAGFVPTARRWLSGLTPQPVPTAFDDLNPENLDAPGSVLGRLLGAPPTGMLHGAIAGTDSGLTDFIAEMFPAILRPVVRAVASNGSIATLLAEAAAAYSKIAMNEAAAGPPMGPRHQEAADLFTTGVSVTTQGGGTSQVPPYAHDFVIPSVSEALYVMPGSVRPPTFLGTFVNPGGTHISGGDENDSDSDHSRVVDLLQSMSHQLH